MLSTELAGGEQLREIGRDSVDQVKQNLSLGDADNYGRETLLRGFTPISARTMWCSGLTPPPVRKAMGFVSICACRTPWPANP